MTFISSSFKWLIIEEITLLILKSVYSRQQAVKPRAECAGVDKSQSLLQIAQMLQIAQGHYKQYHWKWQLFGISVTYTEATLSLSLTLPVEF